MCSGSCDFGVLVTRHSPDGSVANRAPWLGDNTGYERIKAIYDRNQDDDENITPFSLSQYTVALLGNIPSLNRSTADLVRVVIQSEWLGREEDYVELFMRLLANIVTAQGSFLLDTLSTLVENLTDTPPSSRRLPETPPISRTKLYLRVHKTLQYLIRIFPAASSVLQRTISENFPDQTDSRRSHVIYTQNLLKILDYAPELRPDTLALITERLVKIDVQVQVDIEDLEDEEGEGLVEELPQIRPDLLDQFEDDSDSSGDDSDSDGVDEDEDEDAQRTKDIRKNVEKMDSVLDILFSYYNRDFKSSKTSTGASVVIDILMSQFITTILSTHRSRHTQFLLFHFAQQSPDYVDILVGTCVQKVLDKKQPTLTRQNASAYLASFVARGMHVPSNVVRDVFDYIRDELDRMREEIEPTCSGPDLRRYSSYYCLVQSLLYIFCFRWRDLELRYEDEEEDDDDDLDAPHSPGHQWRPGTKEAFTCHLYSKLNPLKVCSPAITEEFARVANHLGVIYIYHIIETNKRIRLANYSVSMLGSMYGQPDREGALSVSQDEGHHHLDAYFPFDPYHLPKSKRWIEGDYRDWSPIPGLVDEEADDSDSDDEDDIGDSDIDGTETDRTGAST